MDELLKSITNQLSGGVLYAMVAVVALAVVFVFLKAVFGRRPRPEGPPDLAIDVAALGTQGPPAQGPVLEFYNVPVRLAAVVLAPAGRVRELPPLNQLDPVLDSIVPGLAKVVAAHRPMVRKWPAQPSVRGFAHLFFGQARLPGDGGKGTPWSSAAGVFKVEGHATMAALVFRTEGPTSHGQEIVEREEQWLGMLRVKG